MKVSRLIKTNKAALVLNGGDAIMTEIKAGQESLM
jgi:hypothetical protein